MKKMKHLKKLWYIFANKDGLESVYNGKRSVALDRVIVGENVMMTYEPLIQDVELLFSHLMEIRKVDPEQALRELDAFAAQGFVKMIAINTGDFYRDTVVNQIMHSMGLAIAYGGN